MESRSIPIVWRGGYHDQVRRSRDQDLLPPHHPTAQKLPVAGQPFTVGVGHRLPVTQAEDLLEMASLLPRHLDLVPGPGTRDEKVRNVAHRPDGSASRSGPIRPLAPQLGPSPESFLLVAGEVARNGDGDDHMEVTPRPPAEMSDAHAWQPEG